MARREDPNGSARRELREQAAAVMRSRPRAPHLQHTDGMSEAGEAVAQAQRLAGRWPTSLPKREPAVSVRGGSPETGTWNTAPPAHRGDAGTGRDVPLIGQPAPLHATNMVDGVYEGAEQPAGGTLSGYLRAVLQARKQRTAQAR